MMSQAIQKNIVQSIHLPPLEKDITEKGIQDYFWPIGFREIADFGKKLEYALADYLRNYSDQEEILNYKILIKHYVCEVCGVFQGDLLRERIKDMDVDIDVPSDWLFYPYTLNETPPPYPRILENLKNIKATPSVLQRLKQPKRILKVLSKVRPFEKGGIKVDGLLLMKPTADDFENAIIATQRTEIISIHAKKVDEPVFLCRSDKWFSEVSDEEMSRARQNINPKIVSDILSIVFKLYQNSNIEPKPYAKKYLEECMKEFFAIIFIHTERLKLRQDIPGNIWTGTSGNIWDMMLRLETLKRGGVVTAHDHSGDRAHAENYEMGWIEMYGATYFATFSERQAESLRKYIKQWPVLDKNPPEIISVGSKKNKQVVARSDEAKSPKNIKKVLLFSTVYDRDRGRGNPIFPMISYIDWQARLIAHLNEWGYQVYLKPHPESPLTPPQAYTEDLNVTIINGRFEDMSERMDLYFFDFTQTSVFKPAVLSDIPIVFVDFKGLDWVEGARELLEKRAEVLEGCFDDKNRVQVNWGEIQKALQTSVQKVSNTEFVDRYYK